MQLTRNHLQVGYMNGITVTSYRTSIVLHLLVIEIDLFYRKVPNPHSIRSHKNAIIGTTGKIPFPLDSNQRMSNDGYSRSRRKRVTHDPSFRPIGSSYSMPTQTPAFAMMVWPTKRTVPRLWNPSWADSTSQRAPIGMSTSAAGGGVSDGGANRPTLCRCL